MLNRIKNATKYYQSRLYDCEKPNLLQSALYGFLFGLSVLGRPEFRLDFAKLLGCQYRLNLRYLCHRRQYQVGLIQGVRRTIWSKIHNLVNRSNRRSFSGTFWAQS